MSVPDVSVIVATRNRGEDLRRLLQSLVRSACGMEHAIEVVVADNGSTDHTGEVVERTAAGTRVAIQRVREPTPGKARALNAGIATSSAAILAFLDDDIIVSGDWATALLDAFSDPPEIGGLGGRVERYNPADAETTVRTDPLRRRIDLTNYTPSNIPIIGCNMAFRAELVRGIGGFDDDVGPGSIIGSGDDADLIYRALRSGVVIEYRPEVLVYHNHGRATPRQLQLLKRRYVRGRGAFYHKFGAAGDRRVLKWAYWEVSGVLKAMLRRPSGIVGGLRHLGQLGAGVVASWRVRGARPATVLPRDRAGNAAT